MNDRKTYKIPHPDPCPELQIEKGSHGRGVGWWVPDVKHKILADFIEATWPPRSKWRHRVFIDLFSGPGRIQVEGRPGDKDGGSLVAWRQSQRVPRAAFTQVIVGDIDEAKLAACQARLNACGAPVQALPGAASSTAAAALALVPKSDCLCLAYLDPYNLEHLHFGIIQTLAQLPRIDFAVHFSNMDLQRNVAVEFERGRFNDAAPGWQQAIDPSKLSKRELREAVFDYWCGLVQGLGFRFSERVRLVTDEKNKPLYRLVFFSRSDLPNNIWADVAQGDTRDMFG